ncbi:MAG: hypothetical protein Q9161_005933 [Pseudevernia consocians]
MSELYGYEACPLKRLGDIRVLTVRRGNFDDEIECFLTSRPLNGPKTSDNVDSPSYEALSYHWGDSKTDHIIKIYTGEYPSWPRNFHVRGNLHSALRHLRFSDRPRTLWIDAICIDQDNIGEKNSQVSFMARIYNQATHVCVWLGGSTENSELAINFISRVVNLDDFDRLVADPRTPNEWAALSDLMKREWFSRRWVVQEIALAKRATLYCGNANVEWSDFAVAVSLFEAVEKNGHLITKSIRMSNLFNHVPNFLGEIGSLGATRLVDATSNLFRKSKTGEVLEHLSSLEALISNLSLFRASKAHDVIYAVLALAKGTNVAAALNEEGPVTTPVGVPATSDGDPTARHNKMVAQRVTRKFQQNVEVKRFVIDYDRDFFEVCKDFLTFTINGSKSLDIICRPWMPVDAIRKQDLPSWLLTMSHTAFGLRQDRSYSRKNANTLVGTPGLNKRNYNASGPSEVTGQWRFGIGGKSRSLYVEGFVVDEIKDKLPTAMEAIIPYDWLDAGGWVNRSALPPDAFWRTLVADRGPNGLNTPAFYPRACKSALEQSVEGSNISTNDIIHNGKSTVVADYLRRVQEVIWSRKLIITENGLLGLGPEKTKGRMLICILYGCSVPVLLRKMVDPTTKEEYFLFIGECYVHGLMDGEAFEIARTRNEERLIEKQVFELR